MSYDFFLSFRMTLGGGQPSRRITGDPFRITGTFTVNHGSLPYRETRWKQQLTCVVGGPAPRHRPAHLIPEGIEVHLFLLSLGPRVLQGGVEFVGG